MRFERRFWFNIPLPEPHLAGLVTGALLSALFPQGLLTPRGLTIGLGVVLALAGAGVVAWAMVSARGVEIERPSMILDTGPYAWTRNPMYLGWTFFYLGITLLTDTIWPLVLAPFVLIGTHRAVLREERELDDRFGLDYRVYKTRVRRYL